ncbi:MAG TPA: carboxypeptidase regulatory-like domain-containing protein [Edaphobacter sp.]|nr:carboxypeptidase regulatory-like domain-containing protein [Edaphobacter sp.]
MKNLGKGRIWSKQFTFKFGVLICCLVLLTLPALAQMDQGTITGSVEDQSGAVVPSAQVTLTNIDTGLVLHSAADSNGIFTFSPIKIGNYEVSASAPGFATTTQQHLHLDMQQRLNVPLTLKPGAVSAEVTVNTAPPLLQTQSGSTGQVMSSETINNIPLNGRNTVYVAQLAAGVVKGVGGRGVGTGDFTANGQRPTQNNFILDGIDNNTSVPDFLNGSSFVMNPPPDALAEFSVQTGSYSAEFGHSAGAVMSASVKSGTNQLHGSFWEYFRNTALDARDFDALTIPTYHQNQFGATLGAPIIHHKLFFFGYAEANRIVFGNTNTLSVPSAKMRQGDFSELLDPSLTSSGNAITLYQPGSAGTKPLACNGQANVICPSDVNATAMKLLNLYPQPNTNGAKLYDNFVENLNGVSNSWQWGTRFDWNVSERDQMFVRFSYLNAPSSYPPPLGTVLDGGSYGADGKIINQADNFAFSETHIFSPNLINELRFGYNYGNFGFEQASFGMTDLAASLGMGGIPGGRLGGGLPLVGVSGITGFGQPGFYPNHKSEDTYQIIDNVTRIMGNHSFKVGVLFQSVRFPFFSPPNGRGTYTYNGFFTSIPGKSNTGFGVADFLLDQMASATVPAFQSLDFSHWSRSAYIQDDWRVTKKLTLNLGLRYDNYQPLKEVGGKFANFYMQNYLPGQGQATLTYTDSQKGAYLSPSFVNLLAANNVNIQYTKNPFLVNGQNYNFAPRIGFAYSMDDKTVIHGGFGIFYGGVENTGGPETMQNYPFQFNSNFNRGNVCKPGNCATDGIYLATGFQDYLGAGLADRFSMPSFNGSQPNVKSPYTESYNLTFQRALSNNLVASLGYVGDVSRHLVININRNSPAALIDPRLNTQTVRPFTAFGSAGINEYVGISSYNSLQAKLQKRYENGLNFLATYTWAHAMDDASQPLGGTGYRGVNLIGIRNDYANSQADVRHRLTFNGYYLLPFGSGRRFLNRKGILDILAGGWATDLQFTAQTGFPFSVGTNLGNAGPNGGSAHAILVRNPFAPGGTPDPSVSAIAPVTCAQSTRTKTHWYNPCAFANPPIAFPNSTSGSPTDPRQITGLAALPYLGGKANQVYGPGYERINLSLFKNFTTFREQYLQFRADVFNLLNTPAYGNPSNTGIGTTGGLITSPQNFQNFTPDARFFQLSAKYAF